MLYKVRTLWNHFDYDTERTTEHYVTFIIKSSWIDKITTELKRSGALRYTIHLKENKNLLVGEMVDKIPLKGSFEFRKFKKLKG